MKPFSRRVNSYRKAYEVKIRIRTITLITVFDEKKTENHETECNGSNQEKNRVNEC